MTYWNGNVYTGPTESAPLDKWAHDACLPADQFEEHTWRDGDVTRHQVWPWHWARTYGAANPCYVCGRPTEAEVAPGIWAVVPPGLTEGERVAVARGLYGFTSDGREYRYSSGHNGLVFTGRTGTEAERAEVAAIQRKTNPPILELHES